MATLNRYARSLQAMKVARINGDFIAYRQARDIAQKSILGLHMPQKAR